MQNDRQHIFRKTRSIGIYKRNILITMGVKFWYTKLLLKEKKFDEMKNKEELNDSVLKYLTYQSFQ